MLQSCRKAGPYQTQHSAVTSTFMVAPSQHQGTQHFSKTVFIPGKLSNSVFFYSFMIAFIYFTHVLHFLIWFICTVPLCVSITAKAQLKLFSCTFECPSSHSIETLSCTSIFKKNCDKGKWTWSGIPASANNQQTIKSFVSGQQLITVVLILKCYLEPHTCSVSWS